uniref:Uncharacterized protein n=1 Tax=Acetithermum autotrophicum TaxID=1446466 RepID=H5SRM6_ACEAU|nr:hypothetical protein HGMM_OP2C291 [Candidatus Acetothermum autotrophicum]
MLEGVIVEAQAGLPFSLPARDEITFDLKVEDNKVLVVIEVASEAAIPQVIRHLRELGGREELSYGSWVQAFVPILQLEKLAKLPEVQFIRAPVRPVFDQGSVVSEGVKLIGSQPWNHAGLTGRGVKVGILDNFGGYEGLLGRELPPRERVTARSFRSDGKMAEDEEDKHGTAVAEVIYDIAPDSQFLLAAFNTDVEFRQAADWLIDQHVDVINTSLSFRSGCFTGPGLLEPTIAKARQNGVLWVTSAGNDGDSHWEGSWRDSNGNNRHEFSSSDETLTLDVKLFEGEVRGEKRAIAVFLIYFAWEAPCTGASDDYDLVIFPEEAPSVRAKSDWLWRSGIPIKWIGVVFHTTPSQVGSVQKFSVVIEKKRAAASPARLDLVIFECLICLSTEYLTPQGSVGIGEPRISPNAFTVGAFYQSTGNLTSYSGRGPTKDGRIKPDIAAPSHVSTVTYGRYQGGQKQGFTGTSAATPHVAGAAALVKQAFPHYTPDQIQKFLEDRAEDRGPRGKDTDWGAGQLVLGSVPEQAKPPSAPSGLNATAKSPTAIDLSWRDNSDNEDGFKIERQPSQGTWREIATVGKNTTSYSDTGLNPSTTYCYRVRAYNAAGASDYSNTSCATTTSLNRPPTADAGPDQTVVVGERVQLDGSRSRDPDGDTLSYSWRFLAKPSGSRAEFSNANSANPTFTPDLAGEYLIELTVDDGKGGQASDQALVTAIASYEFEGKLTQGELGRLPLPDSIRNQLPAVGVRFEERPNTTRRGRRSDSLATVGLSLSSSTGTIVGTPTQAGQFRFLIDALAGEKWLAEIWAIVTIAERIPTKPTADFVASPTDGEVPLTVQFTNRSTGEITSYLWDFGDGSTSTEKDPTYTYRNAGTFTVKLTVKGPGGEDTKIIPDYIRVRGIPTYEFEATLEQGTFGKIDLPEQIKSQLPTVGVRYVEIPKVTRGGRTSDSLAEVGLSLSESTGTIFGTPTKYGKFQFLIEARSAAKTLAEIWAIVTIKAQTPTQPPTIQVAPERLSFRTTFGGANPAAQTLQINNSGGGIMNWTAVADKPWVRLSLMSGTAPPPVTVTVSVEISGLDVGVHEARIIVAAPGATNSPVIVPVSLQITEPMPSLLTLKFTQLQLITDTWERSLRSGCVVYKNTTSLGKLQLVLTNGIVQEMTVPAEKEALVCGDLAHLEILGEPKALSAMSSDASRLALKFTKLDLGDPTAWERTNREGCLVYKNIRSEPNPVKVTLQDSTAREFAIPVESELFICGDVIHLDISVRR